MEINHGHHAVQLFGDFGECQNENKDCPSVLTTNPSQIIKTRDMSLCTFDDAENGNDFECSPRKQIRLESCANGKLVISEDVAEPGSCTETNAVVSLPMDNVLANVYVYKQHSETLGSELSGKNDADETLSAAEIEKDCDETQGDQSEDTLSIESYSVGQENGQPTAYIQKLDSSDKLQVIIKTQETDGQSEADSETLTSSQLQGSQLQRTNAAPNPTFGLVSQAHTDAPWYDGTFGSPMVLQHAGIPPQAAAIQSNFAQTMTQFAPSIVTCNMADMASPSQKLTGPMCSTPAFQGQSFSGMANLPAAQGQGNLLYTPHPKTGGYMFYMSQPTETPPQNSGDNNSRSTVRTPLTIATPVNKIVQHSKATSKSTSKKNNTPSTENKVLLNSSGEENHSPPDPVEMDSRSQTSSAVVKQGGRKLIDMSAFQQEDTLNREQHNQKERCRRARIKDACDLMRRLVPGMSDKTDKATVFEFSARYIHFLKSYNGTNRDEDFLKKYS